MILGVSIINRLLNPSLPTKHRINSIYRQTIFDVTDLLPPFDDLKSLLKNDGIWWTELEKRLNREQQKSKTPSEMSSYQGSLKDFIDDTIKESPIDIQNALQGLNGLNGLNQRGMMTQFLQNVKEYNEENDLDYNQDHDGNDDNDDNDDDDYEKYVDDDIADDFIKLLGNNQDDDTNTNNMDNQNGINRKRKFGEMKNSEKDKDQPQPKKQKV